MNRQASILFNIDSSISDTWLALQETSAPQSYYQRLIYSLLSRSLYTTEGFQILSRQLAEVAHQAYLVRQIETVEQASQLMLALPISNHLKGVAHYYQAVCAKRYGDLGNAYKLLGRVLTEAPQPYKARALLTIGAIYLEQGETEAALPFYLTAGQTARECDPITLAQSQWNIAIVRSIHGDHKQSLDGLERLLPSIRTIGKHYPALYYSFLNSLAIELGEVGRLDEAKAACSIVLASPFASVYPEFAATRDELEAKRTAATPSIVAVSITPKLARPVQPVQQAKPVCTLAFLWLVCKNSVLQTSTAIASAIRLIESIQTIRNRMRFCIHPRGPPCGF